MTYLHATRGVASDDPGTNLLPLAVLPWFVHPGPADGGLSSTRRWMRELASGAPERALGRWLAPREARVLAALARAAATDATINTALDAAGRTRAGLTHDDARTLELGAADICDLLGEAATPAACDAVADVCLELGRLLVDLRAPGAGGMEVARLLERVAVRGPAGRTRLKVRLSFDVLAAQLAATPSIAVPVRWADADGSSTE